MSKSPAKVGAIGCGAVLLQHYGAILPRLRDLKLCYFFDKNPEAAERAATRFGGQRVELEELISKSDSVIVATPPQAHAEMVHRCLAPGKLVLCEKPFTVTLDQAQSIVAEAAARQAIVRVGHMRREYPAVLLARNLVGTGILGPLRSIEVYEGGRFTWSAASDYIVKDLTGGVLFDTGTHCLDQCLYATNLEMRIPTVRVLQSQRDKAEPSHEFYARCVLSYADFEVALTVKLSRFVALANLIRLSFEKGDVTIPLTYQPFVRVQGRNSTALLHAPVRFSSQNKYFQQTYLRMLTPSKDPAYDAVSFLGLTKILETLVQP
jgi:predicted dehydrogenase